MIAIDPIDEKTNAWFLIGQLWFYVQSDGLIDLEQWNQAVKAAKRVVA